MPNDKGWMRINHDFSHGHFSHGDLGKLTPSGSMSRPITKANVKVRQRRMKAELRWRESLLRDHVHGLIDHQHSFYRINSM